jgi:predicted transcriptional regulator
MKNYLVRGRTAAAVGRLRDAGKQVNRSTLAAEMGCSGQTAAARLKVVVEMGVVEVDTIPRRKPLSRGQRASLLEAAIAARKAAGEWI